MTTSLFPHTAAVRPDIDPWISIIGRFGPLFLYVENVYSAIDEITPSPQEASNLNSQLTVPETLLKRIWETVLSNIPFHVKIDQDSDFFQVGGNSLLLVKLQALIREDFQLAIPLVEFSQNSDGGKNLAYRDRQISIWGNRLEQGDLRFNETPASLSVSDKTSDIRVWQDSPSYWINRLPGSG